MPGSLTYVRTIDIPLTGRTLPGLLRRQAERYGDRTWLSFEDQAFSFREIDQITDRLAHGLVGAGIAQGDHVGLIVDNRPEVLMLYFALGKIGAVTIPINTAAVGEQLAYFIDFFDVSTIVLEAPHVERFAALADHLPKVRRAITIDDPALLAGLETHRLEDLLAGPDHPFESPVSFSTISHISFTSGTTGRSKGNLATHCSLITSALGYAQGFGYLESDVLLTCLPLFHSNAYIGSALAALVAGAQVAVLRRFSASAFWDDVRRTGATQFNALGAMANIIWNQPERPDDVDNPVRIAFFVPAPSFAREFEQRFALKIVSGYALSDYGTISHLRPDHPPGKWQSAGQVRPEFTVRVLDEDDLPVPDGEVGEICIRAEHPFISTQGYYKMQDATLASRRNLWFHTGDRGFLDQDGYIQFSDRLTDSIRRRGESISSLEVEQALLRHPDIADVAVFGVKSELSEQEVMASVIPTPGASLDPAAVIEFCRGEMAYFMIPRYIDILAEFPKTPTEKVQKSVLKQRAEEDLTRIWDRERAGIIVRRHR